MALIETQIPFGLEKLAIFGSQMRLKFLLKEKNVMETSVCHGYHKDEMTKNVKGTLKAATPFGRRDFCDSDDY